MKGLFVVFVSASTSRLLFVPNIAFSRSIFLSFTFFSISNYWLESVLSEWIWNLDGYKQIVLLQGEVMLVDVLLFVTPGVGLHIYFLEGDCGVVYI